MIILLTMDAMALWFDVCITSMPFYVFVIFVPFHSLYRQSLLPMIWKQTTDHYPLCHFVSYYFPWFSFLRFVSFRFIYGIKFHFISAQSLFQSIGCLVCNLSISVVSKWSFAVWYSFAYTSSYCFSLENPFYWA